MLYGVYQDWVHQNHGNHLHEGIKEDGKCQYRWKTCLFINPTLKCTIWLSWEKVHLNPRSGAQQHISLEVERRSGDCFSVDHTVMRTTRHWCQKYLRAN